MTMQDVGRARSGAFVVVAGALLAGVPALFCSGFNVLHLELLIAQHNDPDWPAWLYGFDGTRYGMETWFTRVRTNTWFRPVVALFGHGLVGGFPHTPQLFYGALIVMHAAAAAMLYGIARRVASPFAAACGALVFAVHPASSHLVSVGTFPEFLLGSFFAIASLFCLVRALEATATTPRPARPWLYASIACVPLSVLSEESFWFVPIAWLLFARALGTGGAAIGEGPRTAVGPPRTASVAVVVAGLVASGAQLFHRATDAREWSYSHWQPQAADVVHPMLPLLVDPYLYVRKTFLLFVGKRDSVWLGGWDAMPDLSAYAPAQIVLTMAVPVALVVVARKLGVLQRALLLALAPMALSFTEPVLARVVTHWGLQAGMRQVYFAAAMLGLFVALLIAGLERRRRALRVVGALLAAVLVVIGCWYTSMQYAAAKRNTLNPHRARAQLAAMPKELPPGARAYLLNAPTMEAWHGVWVQMAHGDPTLRTTVLVGEDGDGVEVSYTRVDARTIDIERLDGAPFRFLRVPPDVTESYLLMGGRRMHLPIVEPMTTPGLSYPIRSMPGDFVEVLEVKEGRPSKLRARFAHGLDDPRTLLLAWTDWNNPMRRLRCPADGERCR